MSTEPTSHSAHDLSLDYIVQTYEGIRPILEKARDDVAQALAMHKRKRTVRMDTEALEARMAALGAFLSAMDTIRESPSQIPRGEVIQGVTYKIQPPMEANAYYVTINDIILNGQRRPIEVFVNTKNPQFYLWISAFSRLLSAQLQQPGPFPTYVVRELKEVYDLTGGYFIKGGTVPSIVSHIGRVLEEHCKKLGIKIEEKKDASKS